MKLPIFRRTDNERSLSLWRAHKKLTASKICKSSSIMFILAFHFWSYCFVKKMENGKDFWNFIQICGKERKWKGMLSNLDIVERKGKAFQFWQEGKERNCFPKKMDRLTCMVDGSIPIFGFEKKMKKLSWIKAYIGINLSFCKC